VRTVAVQDPVIGQGIRDIQFLEHEAGHRGS
jgi:hypothetical protein